MLFQFAIWQWSMVAMVALSTFYSNCVWEADRHNLKVPFCLGCILLQNAHTAGRQRLQIDRQLCASFSIAAALGLMCLLNGSCKCIPSYLRHHGMVCNTRSGCRVKQTVLSVDL